MRYVEKSALLAAMMFLALAGVASCDDGNPVDSDGDVECPDDSADQWGNCPDGGPDGDGDTDTDSDSDGDTTVTLTVETWTIGPDGTERELLGAAVELRSDALTCPSTPCDLQEVGLGEHLLIITLPGWIQEPVHLAVRADGVEVIEENPAFSAIVRIADRTISVRMERDLTGTWQNDRGAESEVSIGTPRHPPVCPNSAIVARGEALLVPVLCLEGETVTLCSPYAAQECYDGGLTVITGIVEENRMSFRSCSIYDPEECGEVVLTRVE